MHQGSPPCLVLSGQMGMGLCPRQFWGGDRVCSQGGGQSALSRNSQSPGSSSWSRTRSRLYANSGVGTGWLGRSCRGRMDPQRLLQAYSPCLWAMRVSMGVHPASAWSRAVGEGFQHPSTRSKPILSTLLTRRSLGPSLWPWYQSSEPHVRIGITHPR